MEMGGEQRDYVTHQPAKAEEYRPTAFFKVGGSRKVATAEQQVD